MRNSRRNNELRNIKIIPSYLQSPIGSCLIEWGNTKIICSACIEDRVPPFLKYKNQGWLTAEYSMLPSSTPIRNNREAKSGKQTGRTQEIQRLIGRSLRSCIDLTQLDKQTIFIDCDVIQADGGTRVAAITGGFVALSLAIKTMLVNGELKKSPLKYKIVALSAGIVEGEELIDLDFIEDSNADADANIVYNENLDIVEFQVTSEKNIMKADQLISLQKTSSQAAEQLLNIIDEAIK